MLVLSTEYRTEISTDDDLFLRKYAALCIDIQFSPNSIR